MGQIESVVTSGVGNQCRLERREGGEMGEIRRVVRLFFCEERGFWGV